MKVSILIFLTLFALSICSESQALTEQVNLTEISCIPKPIMTKGIHRVCGLFDPKQIQCVRFPCGLSFDSAFLACNDPRVISYINTPCENINTPAQPDITTVGQHTVVQSTKSHLRPKFSILKN